MLGVGGLIAVGGGIGAFLLWGWAGVLAFIAGLIVLNILGGIAYAAVTAAR